MGKRWRKLWVAVLCLALCLTVWALNVRCAEAEEDARQVAALEAAVASLGEAQLEKHRDLAKWYNYQLEQGKMELRGNYDDILNLGNGRMGLLEVPELHLRQVICHGTAGEVGHDPASPLPIGGLENHTVLTLTRWYPWEPEQAVYIDVLGQRLNYRVESVQVMRAGWSVERPRSAGQDLLTLVFDQGSTRTIIRCIRCTGLTVREKEESRNVGWLPILPLCVPWLVFRYAKGKVMPRIRGFYRKTRGKSKLS